MNLILILFLLSSTAFGRWAKKSDMSYWLLKEQSDIKIKANGSYTMNLILEYEILKDNGKEKFSLYEIPFNGSLSTANVIEAKVTNGNQVTKVKPEKIVVRNVSNDNGITNNKVIQIAFPDVQVNSKVFISFTLDYKKVIVSNHFSMAYKIGELNQADKSFVNIESEMPITYKAQDPYNVLAFSEKNSGNKHLISMQLREPYFKYPVDERSIPSKNKQTLIHFSSDKDWNKIGNNFKGRFDKVLNQPVPKEFEKVISEGSGLTSLEDKINYIVSYISQNYNYVGDWRTINGGFSPRSLSEIFKTKYGDCKDFSVLLASLLRKMKVKSDVAVVLRAPEVLVSHTSYQLPSLELFNHAIVKVEDNGKIYWIDPTNPTSYGLNIRNDIAGRPALTLNGSNKLENIPSYSSKLNQVTIEKIISFEDKNRANVESILSMRGSFALELTGYELNKPKADINKLFQMMVSQGEQAIVPEISDYDLKSRQYKPLDIKIKYAASDLTLEKNNITKVKLPEMGSMLVPFYQNVSSWEGDLYVGEVQEFNRSILFKGIFAEVRPKGCNLSTDWLDIKKEFIFQKDGIKLNEKLVIKKSVVNSTSFQSTDFELLQAEISKCLSQNSIEFKWGNKAHAASELDFEKSFAKYPVPKRSDMRVAFVRAVMNKELDTKFDDEDLAFFLKKNIEETPGHALSYQLLSDIVRDAGYYNNENYNKANLIQAQDILKTGLSKNPKHQGLLLDLLAIKYFLGEKEQAKAELPAVLEIGEISNVNTMLTLGRLQRRFDDSKQAYATYLKAQKLAKTKPEIRKTWFELALYYSNQKNFEQCVASYKEVLKIDPKHAYSYINIMGCLLELKKYDEAIEMAKVGRTVTNAGMMALWSADAYITRGTHYFTQGKMDLAEQDYKESLIYRQKSDAYSGLAYVAANKNNFDRALALIMEGTEIHEYDKVQYLESHSSLFFKKSPEHFSKLLDKMLDSSADTSQKLWAYHRIGKFYFQNGNLNELQGVLDKALPIGEAIFKTGIMKVEILLPMAALYSLKGEQTKSPEWFTKARDYLKLAKSLQPDNKSIDFYVMALDRLYQKNNIRMPASNEPIILYQSK